LPKQRERKDMEFKTIEAGGKNYRLAYTTNALCQLEDKVDGTALAGMAVKKVNSFLRYMFWAALLQHQPETTLETAGDIADAFILENGGREAAFHLINEVQVLSGIAAKKEESEKNAKTPRGKA
jgi:hypothetical protein